MNLEIIKKELSLHEHIAFGILEGDRENYDGSDGARYIMDLCGYCRELIKELENKLQ